MKLVQIAARYGIFASVGAACVAAAPVAVGMDLVEVVKKVELAVVRIDTDNGFGSGVVVDDGGLVFTNYHVVEEATTATLTLRSGRVMRAAGFVEIDISHDLALLKTEAFGSPIAIKIARELPQSGEKVAAFGNPKGFSFSTSEGIVSAVRTGTEVSQIIGDESYRALGYGRDATWVQTTAAISPGNSGGPLVNMNVEIVGLNTWNYTRGQNLNFAISAADMIQLLAKAEKRPVTGFDKLPKRAKRGAAPAGRPNPEDFTVELPTGRVFSLATFDVSSSVSRLASDVQMRNAVIIKHPNGALYAAAGQHDGVLDGVTIAQYENQQPMVYVTYADGKRHGILKTWDEGGKPVLFAQYIKGKRHGFSCLFTDAILRMIIEYKSDAPTYVQLLSGQQVLEGFSSREDAEKNPDAHTLLATMEDLEATLKKNEVAFRKQVSAFEKQRRRALASQLGPQKRAQAQVRENQRAAGDDTFLRQLYRKAGY